MSAAVTCMADDVSSDGDSKACGFLDTAALFLSDNFQYFVLIFFFNLELLESEKLLLLQANQFVTPQLLHSLPLQLLKTGAFYTLRFHLTIKSTTRFSNLSSPSKRQNK